MSISTYDELKASIANWLNRDDLTAVIPDFISLTEKGLDRTLRHWRMEERATATLNSQYEALPARWIAPIRLSISGNPTTEIKQVGQANMQGYRAESNTPSRPKFYALTQGELEFYPTPDADYELEMVYYEKPEALSDSNASNWILEYFPDLYLYGSLAHSAPYLSDDARLQVWATMYQQALESALMDEQKAKYGGSNSSMKIRAY